MKTSENGLNLIKEFEGLRLTAYRCAAGVWTIGYGHTSGVKEGDEITHEQAEDFLLSDIKSAEKSVNSYGSRFNQNQFDALVSFTFNCGAGNLAKLISDRSNDQIGEALLLYNKAGGKLLNGLVRRRSAERALYFSSREEYYPAYTGSNIKIDDIMESIGAYSDYLPVIRKPYQRREPIAKANGIMDYEGSGMQNTELIRLAKAGKLKRP